MAKRPAESSTCSPMAITPWLDARPYRPHPITATHSPVQPPPAPASFATAATCYDRRADPLANPHEPAALAPEPSHPADRVADVHRLASLLCNRPVHLRHRPLVPGPNTE